MEILLHAFANSREEPLQTLTDEYAAVNKTLAPRVLRRHFLSWSISHATLDDIAFYLTLFRENLSVFQFSGHAGRDVLFTEDGPSRAAGIAHLLGQCPNLKVVILNGCSTVGQVAALHQAGIPLVIATSAPVGDAAATRFSARLVQALEAGSNIRDAFELAAGEALARAAVEIVRSPDLLRGRDANAPLWGIFPHPDKPAAPEYKLPVESRTAPAKPFEVNEVLLEKLYETFAETNVRVQELQEKGATLDEDKEEIVAALLRALPAPISEHVRKLVAPSPPGATEGWDKAGALRLAQLVQTYQIGMDFLLYVYLAHLWDNAIRKPAQFRLRPEQYHLLRSFFELDKSQRRHCDYFSALKLLGAALEDNNQPLFILEFKDLRQTFKEDEAVKSACFFLENIGRMWDNIGADEAVELCYRAEESLALVFSKVGFLGHYLLATVRNIDVRKYRHMDRAEFEHMVVKWHGTLGYYEKEFPRQVDFMDNRSVVLLHAAQAEGQIRFLNLSPFIVDENTFEAVPDTSLAKLFFFDWREVATGHLYYKYVNDPNNDTINLEAPEYYDKKKKATKFHLAVEQFNAFLSAVVNASVL